jgi:biopolymer transport protein ExbD
MVFETVRHSTRTGIPGSTGAPRRAPGEVRADINVTPLVDVVLVLLIIFMVVGPAIAQGVPVDLPRTAHHSSQTEDGKDLVIAVSGSGQLFVGTTPVEAEMVTRLAEAQRARAPEKKVHLKADRATDYRTVRKAIEAIHKAGVEQIELRTEPLAPTER